MLLSSLTECNFNIFMKNEAAWKRAKKQYRLSNDVMTMAQKLGLNPKKLGKIANHKQEPWKVPLPDFIRHLHEKRFGEPSTRKR